ncbi:MAG: hypothetical protein EOP84_27280, partial [Verrucomicrobiaceae bacterium]
MALLHGGAQVALSLLVFWGLLGIQFGLVRMGSMVGFHSYVVCSLVLVASFVLYLVRSSLWDESVLHLNSLQSAQLALRQVIHVSAPIFLYMVAAKDQAISRVFLFSFL